MSDMPREELECALLVLLRVLHEHVNRPEEGERGLLGGEVLAELACREQCLEELGLEIQRTFDEVCVEAGRDIGVAILLDDQEPSKLRELRVVKYEVEHGASDRLQSLFIDALIAHRDIAARRFAEGSGDFVQAFIGTIDQSIEDRLLRREVLVDRALAYSDGTCEIANRRSAESVPREAVERGVQKGVTCVTAPSFGARGIS